MTLHADEQAPSHAQRVTPGVGSYGKGPNLILGIDPGLRGALALYDPASDALSVFDVPTLNVGTKKKQKTVIDEYALARALDDVSATISAVWIEQSWPRPHDGAIQGFSFGRNYGLIRGICAANFLPLHDVSPQRWKAHLQIAGDKDNSRLKASALLPRSAHLWPLKKHADRAEAALIALYGANQRQAAVGAAVNLRGHGHDTRT